MGRAVAMGCNPTADYWRHSPKTDPAPQSRGRHDTKKAVVKRPSDTDLAALRSGAHDLSTGGTILNHPFSTPPFRRALFCCCHSAASAFLCHTESFWLLCFYVYRRAAHCAAGYPLSMGCNPTVCWGNCSRSLIRSNGSGFNGRRLFQRRRSARRWNISRALSDDHSDGEVHDAAPHGKLFVFFDHAPGSICLNVYTGMRFSFSGDYPRHSRRPWRRAPSGFGPSSRSRVSFARR